MTAVPLGMSRDFLAFMAAAFVYAPLLAIAALLATVWLIVERGRPSRRVSIAWALVAILAAVPLYFVGNRFSDPIRFAFWAPFHTALLERYSSPDGIVTDWDSWGFGGTENDSYLVADHGRGSNVTMGNAKSSRSNGCGRASTSLQRPTACYKKGAARTSDAFRVNVGLRVTFRLVRSCLANR
jgi:hypothetical protein